MKDKFFENLVKMSYNNMYLYVLLSALDLDIFSYLDEYTTSKNLSETLKLHQENTEHFLNALYSMELIDKKEGKFKNIEELSKYLVKYSPFYMGDLIRVFSSLNDFSKMDFVSMVKNGPNKDHNVEDNLSFEEMYDEMIDSQKGIRELEVKNIVSNLKEYPKIKKILDLGCGAGILGMSIVNLREDIEGVLFDLPPMEELISRCVNERKLNDRVSVKLGDYSQDDIGNNYDLVIASGTLNFRKDMLKTVLKKIYNSLNEKGVFIGILDEVEADFSKPKEIVVAWLPYSLNGINMFLVKNLVKDVAEEVGFKEFEREEVMLASGPMTINIFRK